MWLFRKEWRELIASRAWWAMLACIGPLVGLSFISAVRDYAEISAGAGSSCGIVCAPLIGIWTPTFGAYEIAAIFLLPFVAIRLVSGDQLSGALKLELQRPLPAIVRLGVKAAVLFAGWMIAGLAALAALVMWRAYGGSVSLPEILVAVAGHWLNGALVIALAVAVASMTEHPSTAAIITLAITIGTWMIDFEAAVHGGFWEQLAAFTPASMVSQFQHGLVQTNVVLAALTIVGAGLAVGAIWMRLAVPISRRALETVTVLLFAGALAGMFSLVRGSWDVSESRQNSFPEADQEALERLATPVTITMHLSPQDPRRLMFERGPLAKLRRTVPRLVVKQVSRTSSGLFEQADPGYGEITYEMNGKSLMNRAVTDEAALETIFDLTGAPPDEGNESEFSGHPLVARPSRAGTIFYGVWPAAVLGLGLLVTRRNG